MTADEMATYPPDTLYRAFEKYSLENKYDYEMHVKIGEQLDIKGHLPSTFMSLAPGSHNPDVWHDVNRMRTLNSEQARKKLNMHICPLQFDIVERIIERYTNKGEVVFDPFGGIMTVPYMAIKKGRIGKAVELNTEYFIDGVKHLKRVENDLNSPTLFDFEKTNLCILQKNEDAEFLGVI